MPIHNLQPKIGLNARMQLRVLLLRRNVITALGHFASWVVEILVFGVLEYVIVAHRDAFGLAHYIFLELVPSINYVVFPAVQTLSSHDLRAHVFSTEWMTAAAGKGASLCARACCASRGEAGAAAAAVDAMELQGLPNGNALHL